MRRPSVYYKLTSYDNIAAWSFLLAIVLARNNRRGVNSCVIHHVSVCRCCRSWLEESGFLLQFIAFPQRQPVEFLNFHPKDFKECLRSQMALEMKVKKKKKQKSLQKRNQPCYDYYLIQIH